MIRRVVRPNFRVLEYGAGNSSLWWASQVLEVVSIEHDATWVSHITGGAPKNLTVLLRPMGSNLQKTAVDAFFSLKLPKPVIPTEKAIIHGLQNEGFEAYVSALADYPVGHFDIVVIDGMARIMCAWLAAHHVSKSGFIIFDNSDRKVYNEGFRLLSDAGFKRIDFYGTGPVNPFEWCTSIFAKNFDWLSINRVIPPQQVSDLEF
jgi:hypothetical protein